MASDKLETITWEELRSQNGTVFRPKKFDLRRRDNDSSKLLLLLEVDQGGGQASDVFKFEWDRLDCLNWLKTQVRKLEPTVEEDILEELRAIRDKLESEFTVG